MPKQDLPRALSRRLEGARFIAVLGVGSELRGDDAAGVSAAEKLAGLVASGAHPKGGAGPRSAAPPLRIIVGGTAPENVTGEIKAASPSHLIVIDCADMGLPPGSIRIVERSWIAGASFGTHRASLGILLDYISREAGCDAFVLAIQPAGLGFEAGLDPEVSKAVDEVARAIMAAVARFSRRHAPGKRSKSRIAEG
jgi:hydrogenase 3 maturation protease